MIQENRANDISADAGARQSASFTAFPDPHQPRACRFPAWTCPPTSSTTSAPFAPCGPASTPSRPTPAISIRPTLPSASAPPRESSTSRPGHDSPPGGRCRGLPRQRGLRLLVHLRSRPPRPPQPAGPPRHRRGPRPLAKRQLSREPRPHPSSPLSRSLPGVALGSLGPLSYSLLAVRRLRLSVARFALRVRNPATPGISTPASSPARATR